MTRTITPTPEALIASPEAVVAELARRGDSGVLKTELGALLADALSQGRAAADEMLRRPRSGLAAARRLSTVMDAVVKALHAAATGHLYNAGNPSTSERIAVAAVGGYGRGTLAQGSDVDILFLFPHKQTGWGESVVESILYPLWDLKLKVGHSTRSIDECMREARGDLTIRTALLEARFICGDEALFDEFARRFDQEIVAGSAPQFVQAKLAEREARVNRAGASRYKVEPNVKDGKGGLRDLNTLYWIAKYAYRVKDPAELVAAGLFSAEEFAAFARAEDFLWRCARHDARHHGARRGAALLRPAAAGGGALRLRRQGGAVGGRALHEGLLPRREGRRRPDGHRLRGAGGEAGEGAADAAQPARRHGLRAPAQGASRRRRLHHRERPHHHRERPGLRTRPGQPRAALRAGRQPRSRHPPPRHAAGDAVAEADHAGPARRPRRKPAVHGAALLAPRAGDGFAADERIRRARPLRARFRARRGDDAVQHVPPLHGGRAPDPLHRHPGRDRRGAHGGRASARQRDHPDHRLPPRALCRAVPARHRQGPPGGSLGGGAEVARKLGPRFGLSEARRRRSSGWWSSIC